MCLLYCLFNSSSFLNSLHVVIFCLYFGSRKHTQGHNSFSANSFGAPLTFSNFVNGNAVGLQKASGVVTHAVRVGFEDVLNHTQSVTRSFEEVDMGLPPGKHRNSKNTASGNPGELILQALREFISERRGVLEEGWKVEFRQPTGSSEVYAVYCAPDGKIFDSVFEVACYLGLMPGYNSVESEMRNDRHVSSLGGSHFTRKRKSTKVPVANGFSDRRESLTNCCFRDSPSDAASAECANACGKISEATLSGRKEDDHSDPQQSVVSEINSPVRLFLHVDALLSSSFPCDNVYTVLYCLRKYSN